MADKGAWPTARLAKRRGPCAPMPAATTTVCVAAAREVFAKYGGDASMEAIAKAGGRRGRHPLPPLPQADRHRGGRLPHRRRRAGPDRRGRASPSWSPGRPSQRGSRPSSATPRASGHSSTSSMRRSRRTRSCGLASRERDRHAPGHRSRPGAARRCCPYRHRRIRPDAADRPDVHQRHAHRGPEPSAAGHDPRRSSSARVGHSPGLAPSAPSPLFRPASANTWFSELPCLDAGQLTVLTITHRDKQYGEARGEGPRPPWHCQRVPSC